MKKLTTGIFAHVDAGKTTLSEGLLYQAGSIHQLGRVDNGSAFLDPEKLEQKRGITIHAHVAQLKSGNLELNLLDTPGHVDFFAQTEAVIAALDYAILIISATDGVTAYTRMIWRLLEQQQKPVFIFINKMDVVASERQQALLTEIHRDLTKKAVDFTDPTSTDFQEKVASLNDDLLEQYLSGHPLTPEQLKKLIWQGQLIPVFAGSALKLTGVKELLQALKDWTLPQQQRDDFSARVFKISHDNTGNRLSWIKINGGQLQTKDEIASEKVNEISFYQGRHWSAQKLAQQGDVVALSGLKKTYPGQGLGKAKDIAWPIKPVLTYTAQSQQDGVLAALKIIADENPLLNLNYQAATGEIKVSLMGEVEIEVLQQLLQERFGLQVEFNSAQILYKETISSKVEAVGHFEPLRHYAEVHLLLEPGKPGSGVAIGNQCTQSQLAHNWQQQILHSLREKTHRGVLIGAPLTDIKITLVAGKGSQVHTMGGDFRQASWRAVRQGLMELKEVGACELLEPWYNFRLLLPENKMGRAAADIQQMGGDLQIPRRTNSGLVELLGSAPVAKMQGYPAVLRNYTAGAGQIELNYGGYQPCQTAGAVIQAADYDPESDADNTPNSVFCTHGAGHTVNWRDVPATAQCPFVKPNLSFK